MNKIKERIPWHRHLGLRLLQILLVLVAFGLLRNCMLLTRMKPLGENAREQYYQMGFEAGKSRATKKLKPSEPVINNPLLRRYYRQGLRDGWDSAQNRR